MFICSANASAVNVNMGHLYSDLALREVGFVDTQNELFCKSISYFKEAVRISKKVYGPTHPKTIEYEGRLEMILIIAPVP